MLATGYSFDLFLEKNLSTIKSVTVDKKVHDGNTIILGIGTGIGAAVIFKYPL